MACIDKTTVGCRLYLRAASYLAEQRDFLCNWSSKSGWQSWQALAWQPLQPRFCRYCLNNGSSQIELWVVAVEYGHSPATLNQCSRPVIADRVIVYSAR
jgi:hypothetical protein